MQKTPSKYGSPDQVEPHDDESLNDSERVFKHGATGNQGGDRGNEYQALWMTLACLNAVFAQDGIPKLTEIILEGDTEPYDDIELRKNDGSYTYFQSKHRDTSGSGNITIAELIELPPQKETKKSGSTAFSLPKYFKGMMTELARRPDHPEKKRFVICASAPFSTTFKVEDATTKNKSGKIQITLENNTWTAQGIFTVLTEQEKDSFLTHVHLKDEAPKPITSLVKTAKPQYFRFSDTFINDSPALTVSQQRLRKLIFDSIKAYITREQNEAWVTTALAANRDQYIMQFLRKLQWWITQPKLEELKESVVNMSVAANFGFGSRDIRREFYEMVRISSDRKSKSLDLKIIADQLKKCRGQVLFAELAHNASQFHNSHFLRDIPCTEIPAFNAFLTQPQSKFCLLTCNTDRIADVKYALFTSLIRAPLKVLEDWLIVDAVTKPLIFEDKIQGQIDIGIEDLFNAGQLRFLVIDNAHLLLASPQRKECLRRLAQQTQVRVVLVGLDEKTNDLEKYFQNNLTKIPLNNPNLQCLNPMTVISGDNLKDTTLVLSAHKKWKVRPEALQSLPSVSAAIKRPAVFADFVQSLQPTAARAKPDAHAESLLVPHFIPLPLIHLQPYYQLSEVLKHANCGYIEIEELPKATQEKFSEQFPNLASGETNNKITRFTIDRKSQRSYRLKHLPETGEFAVAVVSVQDHAATASKPCTEIPAIFASEFIEISEQSTQKKDNKNLLEAIIQGISNSQHSTLLKRGASPRRSVIIADYGLGKTSVLKQLYSQWCEADFNSDFCDWAIPCHFTKISQWIEKQEELVPLLLKELQRQALIPEGTSASWLRESLSCGIQLGHLQLLCDGWDELHDSQYDIVGQWLQNLPLTVNLIVVTRPHAAPALLSKVQFHQNIRLSSFDWPRIKQYIKHHFVDLPPPVLDVIYNWLGNGENESVSIVLQRPLHLRLLCEAVEPYLRGTAPSDTPPPWKSNAFYRLNLYQLILKEQFRKYLFETRRIHDRVTMHLFMQAHYAYLRELGFFLIFDEKPISLQCALDEQSLLNELYNIGILNARSAQQKPEFIYRIFSEYFAAQYILNALLRGTGDFIYASIMTFIKKQANNPRYEQVWRLLGEMIRFGEPFLNYSPNGPQADVLSIFPDIASDDISGNYYRLMRCYLNGGTPEYPYRDQITMGPSLYELAPQQEEDAVVPRVSDELRDKSPLELLHLARASKDAACRVVSHLIYTKQMTDNWLCFFYYKEKSGLQQATNENLAKNLSVNQPLSKLAQLVETFKWPDAAWGGYWDLDALLPCIRYMNNHLFLHGAGYFIYRVLDKNNKFFDHGLASACRAVIEALASCDYSQDISSIRFFCMMLQLWLSKPNLVSAERFYFIIPSLKHLMVLLSQESTADTILAIQVLYRLSFVYRLRVTVEIINTQQHICIFTPNNTTLSNIPLSEQKVQLLQQIFDMFRKHKGSELFNIQIDGGDLIQPISAAVAPPSIDEDSEINEETASTENASSL